MLSRAFRCFFVWLLATAPLGGLGWVSLGSLASARDAIAADALAGQSFETLLVWLCSALVGGCSLWLWLTTTVVVVKAARFEVEHRVQGCPEFVRRGLLLACGVAIAGTLALPAHAAPAPAPDPGAAQSSHEPGLIGLPLPERTNHDSQAPAEISVTMRIQRASEPIRSIAKLSAPTGSVTVRAGDSLWEIASSTLGQGATNSAIAERAAELHELNVSVIGADPDVILPGQELRLSGGDDK